MSNFTGVAGDPVRDSAQQELAKSIGNESTRPRSIELAIRIENSLFERVGRRTTGSYSQRVSALVEKLKHPQQGYELNGRLLTGMTTPERFIEEEVPEEEPELPVKKEKPKPKPAAPAPAPQPIAAAPAANAPAPSPQPITPAPAPAPVPVAQAPSPQPISDPAPMDVSTPSSPAAPAGSSGENKEVKSKTETSSYYFFKSTDPEQAKKYAPKPISPNELPAEPVQPTTGPATSKWNMGGTFEERDVSGWARKRLAEMLSDLPAPVIENGDGSFSSDWTVTGEATAVFSRGKKRVGYELVVKSTYRANYKGKSLSGRVEIPSLDNTYGANEYKINFTSSGSSAEDSELKQIFTQSSEEIRKRVSDFLKELADK